MDGDCLYDRSILFPLHDVAGGRLYNVYSIVLPALLDESDYLGHSGVCGRMYFSFNQ
jgi:hypothetical protein